MCCGQGVMAPANDVAEQHHLFLWACQAASGMGIACVFDRDNPDRFQFNF
jgi:hypothetical protein